MKRFGFLLRMAALAACMLPALDAPLIAAPAMRRLRDAGAIILGKTTTSEFGWTGVSRSPLTGITHNPWKHGMNAGAFQGFTADLRIRVKAFGGIDGMLAGRFVQAALEIAEHGVGGLKFLDDFAERYVRVGDIHQIDVPGQNDVERHGVIQWLEC